MELTFENILSHINTIYVLRTQEGLIKIRGDSKDLGPDQGCLRLKVTFIIHKNIFVRTANVFSFLGSNDLFA